MASVTINPLNRVETDIKVKVEIKNGVVEKAYVSGLMYRGFEKILKGHFLEDALVYTPRICGICSISHSVAASLSLFSLCRPLSPSPPGIIVRNIAHAVETCMSHVTQFYLHFSPDLLNKRFSRSSVYSKLLERLSPGKGSSFKKIFSERKRFLEILGISIGKWPHTLAIHPGGVTKSLNRSDAIRMKGVLVSFKKTLEEVLFGMDLESYLSIKSEEELDSLLGFGDLRLFYELSREEGLFEMGRGPGRFLSGGVYHDQYGKPLFKAGFYNGKVEDFDPGSVKEYVGYSYYAREDCDSPFNDESEPFCRKENAYSWSKAPRYKDSVVEVGAIARQVISGDPLVVSLFESYGSTVFTRVFSRLHEVALLVSRISEWIDQLTFERSYFSSYELKEEGKGIGVTEAARGVLMHWVSVKGGLIENYQVISPTTWNASPRDDSGRPGAMELALEGTEVRDEKDPVEVGLVVRSFDPCLVCTVH